VFRRLRSLFKLSTASTDQAAEAARALSALMAEPVESLPLTSLVPIIAPGDFADSGDWPGPLAELGIAEACLTWVFHRDPNLIRYVTHDLAAH